MLNQKDKYGNYTITDIHGQYLGTAKCSEGPQESKAEHWIKTE